MKYQDTQIAEAVASSTTWAEVYRKVTGAPEGKNSPGSNAHFKKRALLAKIDFSHFRYKRKAKIPAAFPVPVVPGPEAA